MDSGAFCGEDTFGGRRVCGGGRVEPGWGNLDGMPLSRTAGVGPLAHGAEVPILEFGKVVPWVAKGALVPVWDRDEA